MSTVPPQTELNGPLLFPKLSGSLWNQLIQSEATASLLRTVKPTSISGLLLKLCQKAALLPHVAHGGGGYLELLLRQSGGMVPNGFVRFCGHHCSFCDVSPCAAQGFQGSSLLQKGVCGAAF